MYKYTITASQNGCEVYVDLITSAAGQYLSRHPHVLGLIKEVLASRRLTEGSVCIEQDMGRTIGNTDIIETSDKDFIYYAQPQKKKVFSRYAKNRTPLPSQQLTIILEQDASQNYLVVDTWIGPYSPPFPGDQKETIASRAYWETHALVQDAQAIQSKTITRDCPY